MWRFQFEGPGEAFTAQLRSIAEGPVEIEVVRTVPTELGLRDRARGDPAHRTGVVTARRIHLCEVRDGQICAVTTYCNGGWDDELRAVTPPRHRWSGPDAGMKPGGG